MPGTLRTHIIIFADAGKTIEASEGGRDGKMVGG